jgi:hypothetical protein
MSLIEQIRSLLDQLEASGTTTATGKVPDPNSNKPLPLSPDSKVFTEDYWVLGRPGAMKGVLLEHYSQGQQIVSMLASGHIPLHLCVFIPEPPNTTWTLGLRSAGDPDVNWIDGSRYRPLSPPGQNFPSWVAAGCPHNNQYGTYDGRGEVIDLTHQFSPSPPAPTGETPL